MCQNTTTAISHRDNQQFKLIKWTTRIEFLCLKEHLSSTKPNPEWADSPENLKLRARTLATIHINTDQKAWTAPWVWTNISAILHKRWWDQAKRRHLENIHTCKHATATSKTKAPVTPTTTSEESHSLPLECNWMAASTQQQFRGYVRLNKKSEEHRFLQMLIDDSTTLRRSRANSQRRRTKTIKQHHLTPKSFWPSMLCSTPSTKYQISKGKALNFHQNTIL